MELEELVCLPDGMYAMTYSDIEIYSDKYYLIKLIGIDADNKNEKYEITNTYWLGKYIYDYQPNHTIIIK